MGKILACKDAEIECDFVARGETVEEVMKNAAEHAAKVHGVTDISPITEEKLRSLVRNE